MNAQAKRKLDILKALGNPESLNRKLQSFRKAAQALSSDHPRLIDKYPNEWVAVYGGKVVAHATTLPSVLQKMKRKKIPQGRTIVRYIEKNQRTMILGGLCSMAGFGNTSGRPYLEALVILPRLNIDSGVSFIVDTGADSTVLMPADAIKMGIDCRKLRRGGPLTGIGGSCKSFSEPAIVVLSDNHRRIFAYKIDILIADKSADRHCASLLGRNILNRLRINVHASKMELKFTLVSADVIVPLNDRAGKRFLKQYQAHIDNVDLPD